MNIENSWFLLHGRVENVRFTLGGFFFLILLIPLQGVSEELMYRSFIMQTVSSWFKLPIAGLIVQTVIFASSHPYVRVFKSKGCDRISSVKQSHPSWMQRPLLSLVPCFMEIPIPRLFLCALVSVLALCGCP